MSTATVPAANGKPAAKTAQTPVPTVSVQAPKAGTKDPAETSVPVFDYSRLREATGSEYCADRLLLTTTEAADRLGVGRSTLYDLIRSRRLRTVRIGRRRLVPPEALAETIALLLEEEAL